MAMTFGKDDSEIQGLEGREREKTERETNENAGDRGRFRKATEWVTECHEATLATVLVCNNNVSKRTTQYFVLR